MTDTPAAHPRVDGPAAVTSELFRSPSLLARGVGLGRGRCCVVTFNCLLDEPDVDAPGFGEAHLADRGIDAVHVTCAGNDWYQYPEWPEALARIRAAVRPYGRVLAYGSSMGGYAAVRYGGAAGAQSALALSPQFSIDPRVALFERRWRTHAERIGFIHEDAPLSIPEATIVYDSRDLDRLHVDRIAEAVPVRRIPLPHAGHPCGAYLAETGLLSDLLLSCCRGDLAPAFDRSARRERRRSGNYFMTVARKVAPHRLATKIALARRAVEVTPGEPVYHSYLAVLLDHAGEAAAAAQAHRRAMELGPHVVTVQARAARFLLRGGHVGEGAALARALHAAAPRDAKTLHLLAVALLLRGQIGAAVRLPGQWRASSVVRDALRLAAWHPVSGGWRCRWTGRAVARLPLHLGIPDELRAADVAWRPVVRRPSRHP